MNPRITAKTILSMLYGGLQLSALEAAARQMVNAGHAAEAEKMFVECAGNKVRVVCLPFFNIDEIRHAALPRIAQKIAKTLVGSGCPSREAKAFSESLTNAVGGFLRAEKRVAARERRKMDNQPPSRQ